MKAARDRTDYSRSICPNSEARSEFSRAAFSMQLEAQLVSWNLKRFYSWRAICLDIWLCAGVRLLGCKIRWKMSTLGEKAQVSCETALGGTKTRMFTAWLAQGNYISKHLWINLGKQMWVFLANCPSTHIHCAVCQLGGWQLTVPPNCSPTDTPIVYPKYSTPCPAFAA